MFGERGYDGATFQAIAARAGLSRPALNHHFSSKRALYRKVLDDTNKAVLGVGIRQAEGETTLVARMTAFISAGITADSENSTGSLFLVTGVLESQRHPDLVGTENDSVRIAREFLTRVVNDAIECGEVAADIDAPALVEALLVLCCGIGLYAGYVESDQRMLTLIDIVRQLLAGALATHPRR